jgi:putative transposase
LIEHIDGFREIVAKVKKANPFRIDAIVVLPDHLHCIWTLPDGDADFSTRWGLIKAAFSRRIDMQAGIG